MYHFLFYCAVFWCYFPSPLSDVKIEKYLFVILIYAWYVDSASSWHAVLGSHGLRPGFVPCWHQALGGHRNTGTGLEVLFAWAEETTREHAQPLQRSVLWCNTELWKGCTGRTSLWVKSLLGAIQIGMGSPLAGCCQSSQCWVLCETDMHLLLVISAVRSASA